MHVARLSLTPVKGTAHGQPERLVLDRAGPRDDRRFCLVDPARERVLRTVENPRLVACRAQVAGTRLSVVLPGDVHVAGDVAPGRPMTVDYWGRAAAVTVVDGPWADAFSDYLGRDVVLAAALDRMVFGGSVTVLTTSSLRELASRLGTDPRGVLADSERFRSTVVVDTGDAPAFVEDGWAGLSLGPVTLRVRGPVPRCAVVRIRPGVGDVDALDPLRALASDRTEVNERGREVVFGVDADVVGAGVVSVGDDVQSS